MEKCLTLWLPGFYRTKKKGFSCHHENIRYQHLTTRRDTTSNWNPCPRVSEVGCFNFAFFVYYFDHFCSEKLSANHGHTFLSANEWSSLRELCLVLKPFEEVTIELSAENYVTLSKLIPMVSILQNQLASVMNDVPLYEQSSKISVCFNRR